MRREERWRDSLSFSGERVQKIEAAFNPARSLRRSWAFLYRAPVLLTVAGGALVVLEAYASYLRGGAEESVALRLLERLPPLPMGLSMPRFSHLGVVQSWAAWIGPILLVLLAVRSRIEHLALRAHGGIMRRGSAAPSRDDRGGGWGSLFLFHLLAFGVVTGSLLLAALPGISVILLAGYTAPGMAALGLLIAVGVALPVWLYVSMGLYLGGRFVVLEGHSPFEAIESSWNLARGARSALIVFRLTVGLFKAFALLVGLALCGVGVFLTLPIARALAEAALSEAFILAACEPEEGGWPLLGELGETAT